MFDWLQYGFMVRALVAGVLLSVCLPWLGTFLVLRRQALTADTLSHVSMAGVAAGLLLGFSPSFFALLFALIGTMLMERLRRLYSGYPELGLSVLLSTGLALAVVLIGLGKGYHLDIFSYLFGSIIVTDAADVWLLAGLAAATGVFVGVYSPALFSMVFDEEHARLNQVPVRRLNRLFAILTALVIAASIRIVGVLLISSLLVLPVAISMYLARGFWQTAWLATGISLVAMMTGLLLSYYLGLAPGGSVVLLLVFMLAVVSGAKRLAARRFSSPT
ncbi:MAG: metal ABC transporter permease [Bacillus thermozeamaize]|uniref:Metal ABC transporter permease n=1 Tax=Bacillus thermozeamaize TaxID=230954 RepID=A0A1Y3PMU3_9BACI|nr:MAG: metal ABC transporter permease [Bacillus thermozeamaize]